MPSKAVRAQPGLLPLRRPSTAGGGSSSAALHGRGGLLQFTLKETSPKPLISTCKNCGAQSNYVLSRSSSAAGERLHPARLSALDLVDGGGESSQNLGVGRRPRTSMGSGHADGLTSLPIARKGDMKRCTSAPSTRLPGTSRGGGQTDNAAFPRH